MSSSPETSAIAVRDQVIRGDDLDHHEAEPNLVLFIRCVGLHEDKAKPLQAALYRTLLAEGWMAPRHSTSQVYYRTVGDQSIEEAAKQSNERLRNEIASLRGRPEFSVLGDWHISYVFMKPILVGQHSPSLLLTDFSFNPAATAIAQNATEDSVVPVPSGAVAVPSSSTADAESAAAAEQ
mmetsp:Transcript_23805/g.34761  ORF Transcript_23805/g.34761 Transcript_23805/m.34761 type:complete len:180 (-) Transcript_23805:209-748(-)|eukprot:CAMPEP_0195510656 /NCGR_PEP_ID=MMETSP0794_2-20130614/3239_1 /TAXON_ID=515487 /ORGANISM="Stephanopyxis turris, Strain CCMP 815" /LENGTH=179 /DNA_ID=CAMNT_0040638123 /DNA_START=173 /DNA_END=715 /DNA_ORIENTATION=+